MKKFLFIVAASSIFGLFSCQKEDNIIKENTSGSSTSDVSGNSSDIKTIPYVWKINSFVVNGIDMTAQFANYEFNFSDPEIIAVMDNNMYYGKMIKEYNNHSFSNLIINFPDANLPSDVNVLNMLNEEWSVLKNQQFDLVLQSKTSLKMLSFHTDGELWQNGG